MINMSKSGYVAREVSTGTGGPVCHNVGRARGQQLGRLGFAPVVRICLRSGSAPAITFLHTNTRWKQASAFDSINLGRL